jgi:hypothetical protein
MRAFSRFQLGRPTTPLAADGCAAVRLSEVAQAVAVSRLSGAIEENAPSRPEGKKALSLRLLVLVFPIIYAAHRSTNADP